MRDRRSLSASARAGRRTPAVAPHTIGRSLAMADLNEVRARVEEVVAAFAKGEIVVVSDDDDRENEGDLFVAAAHCTPEKMAFIIRNTSGIVCAPLAPEEAKRLHVDPMVALN